MKFRKRFLPLAGVGALLLAGHVAAQQAPMTPPSPDTSTSADSSAVQTPKTATYQTPQGELTVRSTMPDKTPMAPPPFEQLADGGHSISQSQANAYPLLANDFGYADANHNHRISRAEYKRWARQQ
jgi:hypothetical protein